MFGSVFMFSLISKANLLLKSCFGVIFLRTDCPTVVLTFHRFEKFLRVVGKKFELFCIHIHARHFNITAVYLRRVR